jgi:hypothetical protein
MFVIGRKAVGAVEIGERAHAIGLLHEVGILEVDPRLPPARAGLAEGREAVGQQVSAPVDDLLAEADQPPDLQN